MKNVYLIGMMGAGKTCIGKIVAEKTHRRFVDMDELIEKNAGMTVTEIFTKEGEAGFRKRETAVLATLAKKRNYIVSTGGGAVITAENIALMKRSGIVIWLKRNLNTIIANPRIRRRPLLAKNENAIYDIMQKREPFYKEACNFVVYNDADRIKTVNEILRIIK